MVGRHQWAILGRDLKIFERPDELAAYKAAKVHVFLLPNKAKADVLLRLVHVNLAGMCAGARGHPPKVWNLTEDGIEPSEIPEQSRSRRRRSP